MWQATNDLIHMKQHKKDIQKYHEDFKTWQNYWQKFQIDPGNVDTFYVENTPTDVEHDMMDE